MEKPFHFPLTMKNGRVYDSAGKDITEAYQRYKQEETAEKLAAAFEVLARVKAEGHETRRLLFIDTAYKYAAVVETFVGDDLSERLGLSYAGQVKENEDGSWGLGKLNRMLVPLENLPQLYSYVAKGYLTITMAEQAWDQRNASIFVIKPAH